MKPADHLYETRGRSVYWSHASKTIGQRSVAYFAPRLFKELPNYIKNITSYIKFKVAAKNWILEQGYMFFNNLINLKYLK